MNEFIFLGYNIGRSVITIEKSRQAQIGKKATEKTLIKKRQQKAWNKGIPRTEEQNRQHSEKLKELYRNGSIVIWNKGKQKVIE